MGIQLFICRPFPYELRWKDPNSSPSPKSIVFNFVNFLLMGAWRNSKPMERKYPSKIK
jgi:hypothetical protein